MQRIQIKESCKKRFAPVVEAIRNLLSDTSKKQIIIALDGRCASGKSTLGYYLQEIFDANLFHMDDFFLQTYQRTKERLMEPGGNVDYERFKKEVIESILKGELLQYRRFDCKSMCIMEGIEVPFKRLNIIEGSYSMNPYFGEIYDLKIFTNIGEREQLENILHRNGAEQLELFRELWIPKEELYFKTFEIKEKSDIVVEWNTN